MVPLPPASGKEDRLRITATSHFALRILHLKNPSDFRQTGFFILVSFISVEITAGTSFSFGLIVVFGNKSFNLNKSIAS